VAHVVEEWGSIRCASNLGLEAATQDRRRFVGDHYRTVIPKIRNPKSAIRNCPAGPGLLRHRPDIHYISPIPDRPRQVAHRCNGVYDQRALFSIPNVRTPPLC
jgi:hypothetical protein